MQCVNCWPPARSAPPPDAGTRAPCHHPPQSGSGARSIKSYTAAAAKSTGFIDFLLNMVPTSVVDALCKNDILQILVFATMFGIALSHMGRRAKPVIDVLEAFSTGMFVVVGRIMR